MQRGSRTLIQPLEASLEQQGGLGPSTSRSTRARVMRQVRCQLEASGQVRQVPARDGLIAAEHHAKRLRGLDGGLNVELSAVR